MNMSPSPQPLIASGSTPHRNAPPRARRAAQTVALGLAAALCGCASSSTQTNRDAHYAGHPQRIFIIESLVSLGDGFENAFEPIFSQDIRTCGGDVAFHRLEATDVSDPLSLNGSNATQQARANALSSEIKAFAPDAVFSMTIVHRFLVNYNQLSGVTINSKLYDYKTHQAVWAGVSNFSFAPVSTTATRAKALHDDIGPKLRRDGVIPDCPALKGQPNAT
jgi:hypothetical protein